MSRQKPHTVQFKAGERNIFLHLLTACNLSCAFCYINPVHHGRRPVSYATLMQWLRLFYDPAKVNNLIFLGGEPTLYKNLPHAIRFASQIGYASITVDTNGYCFHNILERVPPDEAVFSFSLDGPTAEVNDALRGPGCFDTCLANLKRAVRLGFETSVIYTVSSQNIAFLADMPPLLAELGVGRFFIQVIGLRGKAANRDTPLQLAPFEWSRKVPMAAQDAADLGLAVIFPKVYLEPAEPFACAGNVAENYFVFPNGRVYRCPLCEDLPLHSLMIENGELRTTTGLTEQHLFSLTIPEGCVMNKLLQPDNITYDSDSNPCHRISCCLLKQRIDPVK
jgi:MoaA/NifB/PqqE/SkfB family radical SAM enzyme